MKEHKKAIIFFVAFVAIVSLFFILTNCGGNKEIPPVEQAKQAEQKKQQQIVEDRKRVIFNFDRQKINVVQITYNKKKFVFSKGNDNNLHLTEPAGIVEEPSYIGVMSIFLGNLVADKFVTDKPTTDEIWQYGFGRPSGGVATYVYGEGEKTFYIGSKVPDQKLYYVKAANSNTIYTLSGVLAEKFMLDDEKIRDHAVFRFGQDTVTDMSFSKSGSTVYSIKRNGEDSFMLTTPISTNANVGAASAAMQAVMEMKSVGHIPEPGSLEQYGLDNPLYRIDVATSSGKHYVLSIGKEKLIGKEAYAKVDGKKEVLIIDESKMNYVDTEAIAFVDKYLYKLPEGQKLAELRVAKAGKVLSMRFDPEKPEIVYINGKKTQKSDEIKAFETQVPNFTASIIRFENVQIGQSEMVVTYTASGGKKESVGFMLAPDGISYYVLRGGAYTGLIINKQSLEEKFKAVFRTMGF